jgi:hypothetical protein
MADGAVTTVTVVADPTIATQPTGSNICPGGSASLSVLAANGTGTFSYQWQWERNVGNYEDVSNDVPTLGTTYTGATTANLTVAGNTNTGPDGNHYRCIVSSTGAGCNSVASNDADVHVYVNPTWSAISTPTPTTLCVGSTVAFSAVISGGTGGTISWIRSNNATPLAGTEVTVTTGETPPVGTWYYRPHYAPTGDGCTRADGTPTTVTVKAITEAPVIVSIATTTTATGTNPLITDEIVSGTSEASAVIVIYKNAIVTAFTTTATAGGAWSVTVTDLVATDVITAIATAPGKCVSTASDPKTVPAVPTGAASQTFCSN